LPINCRAVLRQNLRRGGCQREARPRQRHALVRPRATASSRLPSSYGRVAVSRGR